MIQYFKMLSYLNAGLWIMLCLMTIGSSYLNPSTFIISCVVGTIFLLVGVYNHYKGSIQ